MKIKNIITIFLIAFLLAACAPAAKVVPTETAMPTSTFTPVPFTPRPIPPTATIVPPTEVTIPDYMLPFIEQGYDKLSSDGKSMYLVVDEKAAQYAPEGGIKYKNVIILSWLRIFYFDESHVIQEGLILDFVQKADTPFKGLSSFVDSNSTNQMPTLPSIAFARATRDGINKFTVGEYPIAQADIGPQDSTIEKIFNGIFPVTGGVPQSISIAGIGKVLPITRITYKSEMKFK
jgi:hypothetical protein